MFSKKAVTILIMIYAFILLSNIVFADIMMPTGPNLPTWAIITINLISNFLVILFALFIIKELPKPITKLVGLTLLITVIGFFFEGVLMVGFLFPGASNGLWVLWIITGAIIFGYGAALSKKLLVMPWKKALFIGLMLGILTNPFLLINITGEKENNGNPSRATELEKEYVLEALQTGERNVMLPEILYLYLGEREQVSMGILNNETQSISFTIKIVDKDSKPVQYCSQGPGCFFWDNSQQYLNPGEARVYAMQLEAEATPARAYAYKLLIIKDDGSEYASKVFFVTVPG
jgi:hypothetical protein